MFKESYQLGLSAGTAITKETKELNKRVLLQRALLFGCIVSFVVKYVICALVPTEGTYQSVVVILYYDKSRERYYAKFKKSLLVLLSKHNNPLKEFCLKTDLQLSSHLE